MSSLEESFAKYDLAFKGKIRNVYNFDSDRLLIVTTDRISAFDFVFDDLIDNKGILLTKMAKFWFEDQIVFSIWLQLQLKRSTFASLS